VGSKEGITGFRSHSGEGNWELVTPQGREGKKPAKASFLRKRKKRHGLEDGRQERGEWDWAGGGTGLDDTNRSQERAGGFYFQGERGGEPSASHINYLKKGGGVDKRKR